MLDGCHQLCHPAAESVEMGAVLCTGGQWHIMILEKLGPGGGAQKITVMTPGKSVELFLVDGRYRNNYNKSFELEFKHFTSFHQEVLDGTELN